MPISAKIREQLISSFRAELTEHIQMMTDGLLALERQAGGELPAGSARTDKQRQTLLEDMFRAAHSLKGAARAVGVTAIEQLAHALEDVLGGLQKETIEPGQELFNACYRGLDAIQLVQSVYESGGVMLPAQVLKALSDLDAFRRRPAGKEPPAEMRVEGIGKPAAEQAPPAPERPAVESKPAVKQVQEPLPQTAAVAPPPAQKAKITESPPETNLVEPPAPAVAPSQPAPADETIRVSVSKLDALMAQLSELLVTKIRAEQRLAQVRHAQEFMAMWQKEWQAVRSDYSRLARQASSAPLPSVDMETMSVGAQPQAQAAQGTLDASHGKAAIRQSQELMHVLNYMTASQEWLREMNTLMNTLAREYSSDTMQMALVIDGLEEEIKRTRMLPLNTITGQFGRMVRDLAQTAGKEATFNIVGGEVELDKRVLEQIKDPLIHLLRNAIDHGVELPEQRAAAGKPRVAAITLTAEQLGKDVVLCVSDDGKGLDVDAIRRAAARRGVPDVQALSEAEVVELIFNPGFSTSPIITDVSGRGVGLDVVRRNVETLRGRFGVEWKAGAGTTFTLVLPLALTSSHGLLVRVSDQLFAVPLNFIERILNISPEHIEALGGHDTLRYNPEDGSGQERPLMLVHLSDVLNLPRTPLRANGDGGVCIPVLILSAERRMAFAVDELAGEHEVVIKGLGRHLTRVGGIAGASVMGDGEVLLILNVSDLIKLALRGEHRSTFAVQAAEAGAPSAAVQRRILVVDDSITTRTLEKNILEAAGYIVQLATDGQEALNIIAMDGAPDLIISDVAMPKLNGFGLTERVKQDSRTASVPVILVTSLDSPEDKTRGIEVGADAYIIKSSFDQTNLLETIEQLI